MIKTLFIVNYTLLLYSCYTDITSRIIGNKNVFIILLVSILICVMGNTFPNITFPLSILLVGGMLSAFGFLGAGDVKLFFALSISLPNFLIINFILMTAVAGLIVTIPVIAISLYNKKTTTVPYGVAITLGYICVTYTVV